MAVHVPLSAEAQAEARLLMLAAHNILNPKDGKPVVTPTQDMVLGSYYLTMERPGMPGEGRVFHSTAEAPARIRREANHFAHSYRHSCSCTEQSVLYRSATQRIHHHNAW